MKRVIISLLILIFFSFTNYSGAQDEDINILLTRFSKLYYSGDLVNAEEILLSLLDSKRQMSEEYRSALYNNLSAINIRIGRYEKALDYSIKAEFHTPEKNKDLPAFADICNNRASIYNIKKSYDLAIQYLDKSIRIYNNVKTNNDKSLMQNLSSAYLNIGIAYYELKKYENAWKYFELSAGLKVKYNLSGLALVYLNIAKTFTKRGNSEKAEEYYLKSISRLKTEFSEEYYRLVDVYSDYGLFLSSVGKNKESFDVQRKALSICIKNYGEKHTFVSSVYNLIGDHHLDQHSYDSALYYYQKSLISVVKNFNDTDIFSNPAMDSSIFDIRLLDNLKSKALALELFAGQQKTADLKLKTTQAGLETIELALQLIDRIRNSYLTEESRIYLAENEKETYMFAVQFARNLFDLTGNRSSVLKMYDIAKKAKAAVLRNEISENELSYTAGIPDSLRNRREQLSGNIAAYNNLILDEMRKKEPDNKKITFWKDALFEYNRESEKVADVIDKEYPQFLELLQKTVPVSTDKIQKRLRNDEAVLDYMLSNQYYAGKRKLYTFILTRNRLEFLQSDLDSAFTNNIAIITKQNLTDLSSIELPEAFRDYTSSLYYFYENLIKPAESFLSGKRLIIIPDEEIGQLPFDAFIKKKPAPDQTDYEGLPFLIEDYAISFRYASSMIRGKIPVPGSEEKVYAFSPAYAVTSLTKESQNSLLGAGKEIDAIMKLFPGKKFTGVSASKSNFMTALKQPAIFHLAMHSQSDSSDSRYSYLIFDQGKDSLNKGKLYNYEISLSRISSPMVVLSACNSGTGILYHGEGIMSLARGFILAGASSVIKTAWEVNDETSARIISRFYFHLSTGKTKDEAMRFAKLEYIKSSSPVFSKPYYWAAYEVLGDNSRVTAKHNTGLVILILSLAGAVSFMMIYFKRRRISFDRSL